MGTCSGSYSRQIPRRMGRADRPLRRLLDSSTSTRCISPRFPVPGSSFLSLLNVTWTVWSHTHCPSMNEERIDAKHVARRSTIPRTAYLELLPLCQWLVSSHTAKNNIPEGTVAVRRPKHSIRYPMKKSLPRSPTVTCEGPEARM